MRLQSLLVPAFLFLALCPSAKAAVIHVPADYPKIQQAVAAAGLSDTVLVAEGVYPENILIIGKGLTLASQYLQDGDPAHILNTVIDASTPTSPDTGSGIILLNTAGASVTGFTITGGTGTVWLDQSDGLFYREGGGILTEGGTPVIRDNVIIGNKAINKTGITSAGGGGIRCGFGSATITHNVFAYNEGLYGAGVVVFQNPSSIRNNIIYENSGGSGYGGGGIWATASGGGHTIVNNTILNNHSLLDGGGILVWNNTATMVNNVIRGNTCVSSGPQIGLRSNTALSTATYSDVQGGFTGTGNVDTDPLWALPSFSLQAGSPCIDAGNPGAAFNDREDGGNPGMALSPAQGTVHNDMGADGGPNGRPFPEFNSPQGYLAVDSVNFGTVAVSSNASRWVPVAKLQFGVVRVDSVVFTGGGGSLSNQSTLPRRIGPLGSGVQDSLSIKWAPTTYGPLAATLKVYHSDVSAPSPLTAVLSGSAPGKTGDTNFDGVITSSDIIYLVNFVFKGGPAPLPVPRSGDIDCGGTVTSADIIGLVNYVFKGGAAPCV